MKKLLPIILGLALCSTASAALREDSGNGPSGNDRRAPRDRELKQDMRDIKEAQRDLQQAQQSLRNADSQRERKEAREDVKDARNDLKRASKELKEDLKDRQNGSIRPRDNGPVLLKRQVGDVAGSPDRGLGFDDGGVGPVRPDREIMEDRQKVQRADGDLRQAKQSLRNADSQRERKEAREDVKDARNDLKRASKELKEDLRDRRNDAPRGGDDWAIEDTRKSGDVLRNK